MTVAYGVWAWLEVKFWLSPLTCVVVAGRSAVWLHSCCQHNGRWLLTTDYDGCTLFTTADNTDGRSVLTAAVLRHRSRTGGRINRWTYFCYLKTEYLPMIFMRQQNQPCQLLHSISCTPVLRTQWRWKTQQLRALSPAAARPLSLSVLYRAAQIKIPPR